jgi:transcriptional regulator with XRE-family HTH domain
MEAHMPIIPETLKALRETRGLSQQRLADRSEEIEGAKVSKRTIARIESGEIRPDKVRAHTLESLAKALEVKPDDLCKQRSEVSDADWKERGYTSLRVLIRDSVRSNYGRVVHHYGVNPKDHCNSKRPGTDRAGR